MYLKGKCVPCLLGEVFWKHQLGQLVDNVAPVIYGHTGFLFLFSVIENEALESLTQIVNLFVLAF
jgi:hypothetical protein